MRTWVFSHESRPTLSLAWNGCPVCDGTTVQFAAEQVSSLGGIRIQRCIHAMFRAWREMGYVNINPMGLHGAGSVRKVNTMRAVAPDLYELVLEAMDAEEKPTFSRRQSHVRDRFIFIALRELGLRTSELVRATMSAFYQLSDPQDGKSYWIMVVREETAKGQKERKMPVPCSVLEALGIYREAFGMAA